MTLPSRLHANDLRAGYSSIRENIPAELPDRPPFTAHLGNLSYDATVETVTEFFEGCETVSVRIIEDRELQRPKGFGYVEFTTLDALKQALTLDGESFQGRVIRIKVADPRKCTPPYCVGYASPNSHTNGTSPRRQRSHGV